MVKLCERLIAGARLRLWADEIRRSDFYTAFSNVCPWLAEPIFWFFSSKGFFSKIDVSNKCHIKYDISKLKDKLVGKELMNESIKIW